MGWMIACHNSREDRQDGKEKAHAIFSLSAKFFAGSKIFLDVYAIISSTHIYYWL